jgi:hypothetical protein
MDKDTQKVHAVLKGINVLQLFSDFAARGKGIIKELATREDFEYIISDPVVFTAFMNARIDNRFIRIKHNTEHKDAIPENPPIFDIIPVHGDNDKAFVTLDSIGVITWLEGAVCITCVLVGCICDINGINILEDTATPGEVTVVLEDTK